MSLKPPLSLSLSYRYTYIHRTLLYRPSFRNREEARRERTIKYRANTIRLYDIRRIETASIACIVRACLHQRLPRGTAVIKPLTLLYRVINLNITTHVSRVSALLIYRSRGFHDVTERRRRRRRETVVLFTWWTDDEEDEIRDEQSLFEWNEERGSFF